LNEPDKQFAVRLRPILLPVSAQGIKWGLVLTAPATPAALVEGVTVQAGRDRQCVPFTMLVDIKASNILCLDA
jgi:hypothetical protein